MDTVPTLVLLVFGLSSAWIGWRALGRARTSSAWPLTPGEIIASAEHIESNGVEESRRGAISYRYVVDGTSYQSKRIFFGDAIGLYWDTTRQQKLAAYPVGQQVRVAYDPAAPHQAVLEPGSNWASYVSVLAPAGIAAYALLKLIDIV